MAGGKNFFSMGTFPYDTKNGWIFNSAVFILNNKRIIKMGVEKQIDNGIFYYVSNDPSAKDEIFKNKLNRVSISLSYGLIISQF